MIWSRYHRTSLCMHSLAGETHPYSRIHQSHFPANGYTRLQDVQPTAACMGYGYVRSKLVAWLGLMSACVYRQPTMLDLVGCGREYKNHMLVYNAVHATQFCMLSLPGPLAGDGWYACVSMHENDMPTIWKRSYFPGPRRGIHVLISWTDKDIGTGPRLT